MKEDKGRAVRHMILIVGATRRVARGRAIHRIAPTKDIPGTRSGSVGAIIGQFKSVATKNINTICNAPGLPIWQPNYYEHIIRNENELQAIRQYIFENPLKWDMDNENPSNNNVGTIGRSPVERIKGCI